MSHGIFRQVSKDPSNREFFDKVEPARLSDYYPQLAGIGTLFGIGAVLYVTGTTGWFVLVSLAFAAGMLGREIKNTRGYYNLSIGEESEAMDQSDRPEK